MGGMIQATESSLLGPKEGPPVRTLNAGGRGGFVLVCEHASRFIPAALGELGLDEEAKHSHAAWDIGALVRWLDFNDTDHAVEWCENRLIAEAGLGEEHLQASCDLSQQYLCQGMTPAELESVKQSGSERPYPAGEVIQPIASVVGGSGDIGLSDRNWLSLTFSTAF